MESTLKQKLHQVADKLENLLFGGQGQLNQDQINYFSSFFAADSYIFTNNLIKYFKQELCIGFTFNLLLLCILTFYIPINFNPCWNCNPVMALWLVVLAILNAILVLPKALLIRKLFRIDETADIYMANFSLWTFFRSKVYNFNMSLSRSIFCTYIVGTILFIITWVASEECERFYGVITFLLTTFVLRVLGSFYKFIHNFNNQQETENLIELFKGTSSHEIQSLKVISHNEYKANYLRDDDHCSICYERYSELDEVRVMNCPGDHAFHKKCIDKWLLKSNKCPQCNINIFWKDDKSNKKD